MGEGGGREGERKGGNEGEKEKKGGREGKEGIERERERERERENNPPHGITMFSL